MPHHIMHRKSGANTHSDNFKTHASRRYRRYSIQTLPLALLISLAIIAISPLLLDSVNAQNSVSMAMNPMNPCPNKDKCRDCLQTKGCAWCLKPNVSDQARCFLYSPDTKFCEEQYRYYPQTIQTVLVNEALTLGRSAAAGASAAASGGAYMHSSGSMSSSGFSSSSGSSSTHYSSSSRSSSSGSSRAQAQIVQIQPQRVNLKLRINEEHSLKMSYSQAQDYPVDLYYLMDLSKSMQDDKEKLSLLGGKLSEEMRKITSDFRLGFGSFVDKVLMPYVSTIPKNLQEPCPQCARPYGYSHIMDLSTDTDQFTRRVTEAAVSGNLDAPEGGFDAIMQAIACRSKIGWREQARRLLVFSTDAGFHYAGDGKLGGVITPNDGECHLDDSGFYTYSEIQDYPSISQINQVAKKNVINIIFAVTQNQMPVYAKLSHHIEGSSSAQLSNDSSNVVDLVRDEYNKISSTISMKDNASNNVKITYYSSCLNEGPEMKTSQCKGLRVGDVVTFTAKIMVTSCPADPKDWKQTINIYPVGINESLVVDLEMLCACDCEHPGSIGYEENSPNCKDHGTYKCGLCECNGPYYGRNCECSKNELNQISTGENMCRANSSLALDCSGRGNCFCNRCECAKRPNPDEIISGQFCECDNFSCERHDGIICSGPDHGICDCGRCVCKPGWSGNGCECASTTDTCMAPNGKELCSGHGDCVCGACKCNVNKEGRYSGKYCEKCPTCSGRCQELKDCVQCQMYQMGPLKDDCLKNCTLFTPKDVNKVEIDETKDEQICVFFDEEDCKFTFKYAEEDNELKVEAQHDRECPPRVFMLGIVLGVIAAIVLIGLAILLLWKLLTTIHDRREFARFEKERMNAKWDTGENPIYKQATSTFKNPMYAGK